MTHNIVAEFSCSVWKSDEIDRIPIDKVVGDLKTYKVINGSIFNEEYNETLDSATLLLSQVCKEDRLSNIKPYDFVRVYDTSTYNPITRKYSFDKTYLVDNFNEKENNINEHIFSYTINLMSETKLLEKIQCPNLVITHNVENGIISKKTIYQHIKQYMDLYVPKVKMYNDVDGLWEYKPLIEMGIILDSYTFQMTFNEDNCTLQGDEYEIIAYSNKINDTLPNIAIDTIEDINFAITTEPYSIVIDQQVSIDKNLGKFKFHGLIQDIPYSSVDDSVEIMFTPDSFVQQGNYYELNISSEEFNDKFDLSRFTINDYTVETDPETQLSSISITMDENSRRIVVYAESAQLCSGSFTINYTTFKKSLSGIVNIGFEAANKNNDFYKRFDYPCADLPFNNPTLRQLLTTLMQQVGCIPIVKNRKLNFLDFQAPEQKFGGDKGYSINNTVNYITRGLSSDSFVNTLVDMPEQVLDSGNEVICETLGFRDSNNVLIKQKENLQLETSFPIYKVNKCILRASGIYACLDTPNDQGKIVVSSSYQCMIFGANPSSTANFMFIYYRDVTLENGVATIVFNASAANKDFTIEIEDGLHYIKRNSSDDSYSIVSTVEFPDFDMNSDNLILTQKDWNGGQIQNITWTVTKTFNNAPSDATGFWFQGICHDNATGNNKKFCFILFDKNDSRLKYGPISGTNVGLSANAENAASAGLLIDSFGGFRVWDMTKLVVENSVRNMLSRNFEEMNSLSGENLTIDNVSKYVYATVGYSIGSKVISGFSEVWEQGDATGTGWIQKDYTYIENIAKVLSLTQNDMVSEDSTSILQYYLANIPIVYSDSSTKEYPIILSDGTVIDAGFMFYNPNISVIHFGSPYFSNWFVDLYYQPLNSFNMSYVKSQEPVDFALEQYSGSASGLTDFDRLSMHEQEQVDRFGNETLTILQRTEKFEDIQTFENGPLYFMDDTNRSGLIDNEDNGIKYIIFKRSFTVNNNCFNVTYVGSKDAILKDYFTSIRTKYRAYKYVDYSQSTLRKEKDVFFVRISSDFYDGDDRIWLGSYTVLRKTNLQYWVYDLTNETGQQNAISYECEQSLGILEDKTETLQTVKNSVSALATNNSIGFVYEYVDNVGAGPYLRDIMEQINLGGTVQNWQIWADDYNEKHKVAFVNYIDFYPTEVIDASDMDDNAIAIGQSPIVGSQFLNMQLSSHVVFSVVNNNIPVNLLLFQTPKDNERWFYKDASERINHTVQFIYYAPNNDVLFGEDFVAGSPLIGRFEHDFNIIYGSDNFEINTQSHDVIPEDHMIAREGWSGSPGIFYNGFIESIVSNQKCGLRVYWHGYNVIKMSNFSFIDGKVIDIAVFKNINNDPEYTDFYFMINDTKSDYVLTDKNGVLYRAYKVKTYKDGDTDEGRKVISLFNNNEGE